MFPIKSHLPLITARIEFHMKELPPPPQITPRRELGPHLRRQDRRNSVPYSRPRFTSEEAPGRSKSIRFDLRSMSPLSEIQESEKSGDENCDVPSKIPKPSGEAGRSNSGGYNLKEALGWDEKRYSEFTTFINDAVAKKLDSKRSYSKQKPADLEELVQLTTQKFNIRNVYSKDWPIRDALKLRLKSTSDAEKKKINRKAEANFKKALRTANEEEEDL